MYARLMDCLGRSVNSTCCTQALPRWIVFNELVLTSKEYVRTVSEIKPGMPVCGTA